MVKLLAGNYLVPVNVKSHGGYTPLHLACQFGHQVQHEQIRTKFVSRIFKDSKLLKLLVLMEFELKFIKMV